MLCIFSSLYSVVIQFCVLPLPPIIFLCSYNVNYILVASSFFFFYCVLVNILSYLLLFYIFRNVFLDKDLHSVVVLCYKFTVNTDLVNIKPLLLGKTGLESCSPQVSTFLSPDECITLFYMHFYLKTLYLLYFINSLTSNSWSAALKLLPKLNLLNTCIFSPKAH